MENLVKLFPEETKYAKALVEARKMHDKLAKQAEASKKIIRTIAKKVAPKALMDISKKIEAKIKSYLVDPSLVETYFSQDTDYRGNVESLFIVNPLFRPEDFLDRRLGGSNLRPTNLAVKELVTGIPGITMSASVGGYYNGWKPATVDGALETFLDAVKGWKNVKGETESQSARSSAAKTIASVISEVTRRLGEADSVSISPDYRHVGGAYRSDLPKGGAYAIGEYKYDSMAEGEIARVRKAVNAALAPYKSQIANVTIQAGDKSWIEIEVTLK